MGLYELLSTFEKMPKPESATMTDAEFDASKDRWRAMNLPDVRI